MRLDISPATGRVEWVAVGDGPAGVLPNAYPLPPRLENGKVYHQLWTDAAIMQPTDLVYSTGSASPVTVPNAAFPCSPAPESEQRESGDDDGGLGWGGVLGVILACIAAVLIIAASVVCRKRKYERERVTFGDAHDLLELMDQLDHYPLAEGDHDEPLPVLDTPSAVPPPPSS
eukprot:TRINITY_DN1608_c0_g2_i8.p2 TRINITY_DN1608_c0_g2~~TRINITY_DN1608_c0_g2_i8.p2  ORF type:complete len:173 (+),score=37.74 TRINITY_DN1608_c0_g2_i8:444-962(+)